jgi:hypothetical protein
MMLRKMFNNPVSHVGVYFLGSQVKVAVELDVLSKKTKSRRDENFHTIKLTPLFSDVEDVYINEQFTEVASSFYNIICCI